MCKLMRDCTICTNKNRLKIEQAILEGKSLRDISKQYKVNKDSVLNHKKSHMQMNPLETVQLDDSPESIQPRQSQSVIEMLANLIDESQAILIKAKEKNDDRLALQAIKQMQDVCLRVLEVRPEKTHNKQPLGIFTRLAIQKGLLTEKQVMELMQQIPQDQKENYRPVFIIRPD